MNKGTRCRVITEPRTGTHYFETDTLVTYTGRDNAKPGRWPAHRWLFRGAHVDHPGRTIDQWLAVEDFEVVES